MRKPKEELDTRKKQILQAIVNEYVETIEPVSSQSLITKYGLNCSSATIRNDMAELEKEGFLEKTHVSSGRVPSDKGYRFYVDELLNVNSLNKDEIKYINSKLKTKVDELEELTKIATNTISEITHYMAVSIEPDIKSQKIKELKFVLLDSRILMVVILTDQDTIKESIIKFEKDITQDQVNTLSSLFNQKLVGEELSEINEPMEKYIMSETNYELSVIKPIIEKINEAIINEEKEMNNNVYMKGADKALDNPEFQKQVVAKKFLGFLDRKDLITDILNSDNDFNVYIGTENRIKDFSDFSIITFKNRVKGKDLGTIGIIGPTRMDYSKVISILKYINDKFNS